MSNMNCILIQRINCFIIKFNQVLTAYGDRRCRRSRRRQPLGPPAENVARDLGHGRHGLGGVGDHDAVVTVGEI